MQVNRINQMAIEDGAGTSAQKVNQEEDVSIFDELKDYVVGVSLEKLLENAEFRSKANELIEKYGQSNILPQYKEIDSEFLNKLNELANQYGVESDKIKANVDKSFDKVDNALQLGNVLRKGIFQKIGDFFKGLFK